MYSEASSKRFEIDKDDSKWFEREVDGFLRGFIGGYSFELVLLISDCSCSEGRVGYSVSGTCARFRLGWSRTVLIAVGCL